MDWEWSLGGDILINKEGPFTHMNGPSLLGMQWVLLVVLLVGNGQDFAVFESR